APNAISPEKLARLVGTAGCPRIIQVAPEGGGLIPGAVPRPAASVTAWAGAVAPRPTVVACAEGGDSPGVAAWLRHEGVDAEILEGGIAAWRAAGFPLVNADILPPRDAEGRTIWVTRSRPKVVRIACPWLIRRFVDPDAVFLFVAP